MIYRENFLDRFSDSIKMVLKNLAGLTLPFILYNILIYGVTIAILMAYVASIIFAAFLYNDFSILSSIIFILLMIFLPILGLPGFVMTLRSLENIRKGEKIQPLENLKYGFQNIFLVTKLFLFYFFYVFGIPLLIFLVASIIMQFSSTIGVIILLANIFIFLYFLIVRGSKATISLFAAIVKDNYSKEFFNQYMLISENKIIRILGNNLGASILVGLLAWIISYILGIIIGLLGLDGNIVQLIISGLIFVTQSIILVAFQYLLYKRLEQEYVQTKKINKNKSVTPIEGKL